MKSLFSAAALFLFSTQVLAFEPFERPWRNHPERDKIYTSQDVESAIFVLEFYSVGCGPCNENAPNVDELAADYVDSSRVQVLDIGLDRSENDIQRWIARHHPNHPVLHDFDRLMWLQTGEQYIPFVLILDCNMNELYRHTGVWDRGTKENIRSIVDSQLASECTTRP